MLNPGGPPSSAGKGYGKQELNAEEKQALTEWRSQFDRCAICHWPESDPRRRLEVHHLEGGSVRSKGNAPFNYLLICSRCHGVHHSGKIFSRFPDITKGILLSTKAEEDPDNYDPRAMAELRHRKALRYEPEPLPDFYRQERVTNQTRARKP